MYFGRKWDAFSSDIQILLKKICIIKKRFYVFIFGKKYVQKKVYCLI